MKIVVLLVSLFANGLMGGWIIGHLSKSPCCDNGSCCNCEGCCHEHEDLSRMKGWVPE